MRVYVLARERACVYVCVLLRCVCVCVCVFISGWYAWVFGFALGVLVPAVGLPLPSQLCLCTQGCAYMCVRAYSVCRIVQCVCVRVHVHVRVCVRVQHSIGVCACVYSTVS